MHLAVMDLNVEDVIVSHRPSLAQKHRWISASHLSLQSPGDAPGKVTRRKMVDKGQVTDDISLTVSAQSLSDVTGTLMACLHDPPPT